MADAENVKFKQFLREILTRKYKFSFQRLKYALTVDEQYTNKQINLFLHPDK